MHEGQIDLLPGERVIWAGQPVRRPLFNPGDLFNIPFGLLWLGGVTLFFFYNHDTAFHMAAWIVLTVAGVFHLVGRPLIRYLRLGSTTYAVTDGRVIATSSLLRRKDESAQLADQADPVVTPGPGKTGTITFGKLGVLAWASANYGAGTGKDKKAPVVLVGVSDVGKLRDKLAKAVEEARQRQAPQVEPAEAEPPKAEAPKAESPKTESPKTEPKTEVPEAEPFKAELPTTELPKIEQPTTELPKVEDRKPEAPELEKPKAPERPKVEVSKAEQPTTELPKVKDPAPEAEGTNP